MIYAADTDDKELLIGLHKGLAAAYKIIYDRYSLEIYRKILKRVKSIAIAEELTQDVFLKVREKRKLINPEQTFKYYLYIISSNTVYDFYRKAIRDKKLQEQIIATGTELYYHTEETIFYQESKSILDRAIADLPKQQREVFTLCKLEGKTYEEASSLLGISTATVRNHIIRATKSIKKKMINSENIIIGFCFKVTSRNRIRFTGADTAFQQAVALQTLDPILLSLPIKARGKHRAGTIVDLQPLYVSFVKELTPFSQNPLQKALGIPDKKYKVENDRSSIVSAKSFERNLEVKSLLTFTEGENIYTMEVNRSMVLLPDVPMMARYADDRVGYFAQSYSEFNEELPVKSKHIISRWRLEPKEEDLPKMKAGELVEPKKPIVFYLDVSTPKKWKDYIKQGIEDWKPAFEAAGFKNAILAKDMPEDDPDFHPEDIRYSVVRYTASSIANAKGPSVTDPRSGEILESDVIIYHNILKLLQDWRFAQTAANDPQARTTRLTDEMMGEAIRYVAAHEIGHSLGLRHNMAASYAFPVDSLRSATFTQQYGTTPSIMDYVRNNYVAQPEDEGVKLTPPLLGMYDVYAINWGYRPIASAMSPNEEIATLNAWIAEHRGDPRYRFGEGDVNRKDPTSQRESLGDDVVKASEYGVKNTQYMLSHFQDWLGREGEKYDDLEDALLAILRQYERYLGHVATVIAGVEQYYPLQGEQQVRYAYSGKQEQQDAVDFILDQYLSIPGLLKDNLDSNIFVVDRSASARIIVPISSYVERLYKSSFRTHLLNIGKLAYLIDNKLQHGDTAYGPDQFFQQIRQKLFSGDQVVPDYYGQLLQMMYVDRLIVISDIKKGIGFTAALTQQMTTDDVCFDLQDLELPSLKSDSDQDAQLAHEHTGNDLYFQHISIEREDKKYKIESALLAELREIKNVAESNRKRSKGDAKTHYDYLIERIRLFLE